MKQILALFAAVVLLSACNSEPKSLTYRGLPMNLPFATFCDSLLQRGFAIDSAKTDSAFTRVVMQNPQERFRLMIAQTDGQLQALQENYLLTTNDSTRRYWQNIRDRLEQELGAWPNCPTLKDDHKVAKFETDGGFVTVTLKNTYTPTLEVLYSRK